MTTTDAPSLSTPAAGSPDISGWHPLIAKVYRYWQALPAPHGVPAQSGLDPLDLDPAALPCLILVDVVGRPPRFRYRLVGTRIVDQVGHEVTGRWIDEVFPRFKESVAYSDYLKLIETRQPQWYRGPAVMLGDRFFPTIERIYLPFGDEEGVISLSMSVIVFEKRRDEEG